MIYLDHAATTAANCAEFNVYGIEVPAETNEAAKAALAEKIEQAEALLATITIGDGVGEYSCGGYTEAEVESLLSSAKGFYDSITTDTEVANIEAYIEFIITDMSPLVGFFIPTGILRPLAVILCC